MAPQVHRLIPSQPLNPLLPGWYNRNPHEPMPWCSWCGATTVTLRTGVTACPTCDGVASMPPFAVG